jgi:hypothetical protein
MTTNSAVATHQGLFQLHQIKAFIASPPVTFYPGSYVEAYFSYIKSRLSSPAHQSPSIQEVMLKPRYLHPQRHLGDEKDQAEHHLQDNLPSGQHALAPLV